MAITCHDETVFKKPPGIVFQGPIPQPVSGYIQTSDMGQKNSLISRKSVIQETWCQLNDHSGETGSVSCCIYSFLHQHRNPCFRVAMNCRPGTPCQPPRSCPHGTPSAPVGRFSPDMGRCPMNQLGYHQYHQSHLPKNVKTSGILWPWKAGLFWPEPFWPKPPLGPLSFSEEMIVVVQLETCSTWHFF